MYRHLFSICFFAVLLFLGAALEAAATYRIIDLHPPECFDSYATDINEKGQVVGLYRTDEYSPQHIFLWDKETGFQYLGKSQTPPLINNLGHVVGRRKVTENFWDGLFKDVNHVFIWKPETGVQLLERPLNEEVERPLFSFYDLFPVSINDHDQILIRNHESYSKSENVWVWQENKYQKVEELSSANYLSNEQVITGISYNSSGLFKRLYLPTLYDLQKGTTFVIPFTQEKISGSALMTDNKGNTLGKIYDYTKKTHSYYLWNAKEGFKKLPTPYISDPLWINNVGGIIGFFNVGSFSELHFYDGVKFINIEKEARIGYSDEVIFNSIYPDEKIKINDRRQIIGTGHPRDKYSQHRAFLIEPVE